jgi:hypothetical protein
MRADAFVGLVILCAFLSPALVWLVLRRWGNLRALPARDWLLLYVLGALGCLAVLPRKHIEAAIIIRWPRDAWAYHLAQVDNEWWEQIGKLAALLIGLWLAGARLRPLFQHRRSALSVGYWVGLCYGMGEALILAALFTWPQWAPLFGMRTYTPYLVGWAFVRERFWAMHLHAVMGALIGLGLYGWFAQKSKARFVAFFVLAMLFHHLVDGLIITAAFTPAVARALQQAGELFVPALVVVGFVVLGVAAWAAGKRQAGVQVE